MTKYASILDRITDGRPLPYGTTHWALKSTDFAGRTYNGFKWPDHGWVEADPAAIRHANRDVCPAAEGDGLCVAHTWQGMRSGGLRALCLLLVAYHASDVLGGLPGAYEKLRVSRVFVYDRLDGEQVVRDHGSDADLSGANLSGVNLSGVNLSDADLSRAYLSGANLSDADLAGADLSRAYLSGANLSGAYLSGAYLSRADLSGANLSGVDLYVGANLSDADLCGANLSDVDLSRAILSRAILYGADLSGQDMDGLRARGAIL